MPFIIALGLVGAHCLIMPANAQSPDAPDRNRQALWRDTLYSPGSVAWARDRVFGAVVSIVTVTEAHQDGRARLTRHGGSGTIISEDGHIVTNAHVAMNGAKFKVILADKTEIDAELVGEDPLSDIAVLKFDPQELPQGAEIKVAQFGDSDDIEIGDPVLAMGAPWGMSHSMSLGIVNSDKRLLSNFFEDDADYEQVLDRDQPTGSYYRWIQHDAAIAPGNSGGPLVSLKGEIIGVNTRGIPMGGDMGFASPSNIVKDVAGQLIERGEVIRSFLGLQFKPIQTTEHDRGVLVNSVVEGSPAEKAGLQPGDLLLTINDQPSTVRHGDEMPEFRRYLSDLSIGSRLKIGFERDGNTLETDLVTEKYEKDLGTRLAVKAWGITVRGMTQRMARNRRLPDADGVLITSTGLGGAAARAKPQLETEDVIKAVDGRPTADLAAFERAIEGSPTDSGEILVEFEREGGRYLTMIAPRTKEHDQRPDELDKPWLPVEVQPLGRALAKLAGSDGVEGFRVVRVYEQASATPSGLMVGDVISSIGETKLRPRGAKDKSTFNKALRRMSVGDAVAIQVVRDGKTQTLSSQLLATPERADEARRVKDRDFDVEVRDVTFFDVAKNRWKTGTRGVVVTEVEAGGWGGVGHLRSDDLILQIGEQAVLDVDDFAAALNSAKETKPKSLRMLVLRGIKTRFLFLQPDWD
jgi:serine protease Do